MSGLMRPRSLLSFRSISAPPGPFFSEHQYLVIGVGVLDHAVRQEADVRDQLLGDLRFVLGLVLEGLVDAELGEDELFLAGFGVHEPPAAHQRPVDGLGVVFRGLRVLGLRMHAILRILAPAGRDQQPAGDHAGLQETPSGTAVAVTV
ncbi:MAG: hypothetical protein M5U25_06475 [Planctomycetota bacterium]|nr:hypothetical protein [Planctomycetota bacterium]